MPPGTRWVGPWAPHCERCGSGDAGVWCGRLPMVTSTTLNFPHWPALGRSPLATSAGLGRDPGILPRAPTQQMSSAFPRWWKPDLREGRIWHFGDILQTFISGSSHFSSREHGAVSPDIQSTLWTKRELGSSIVMVPVIDVVPVGTHADLVEGDQQNRCMVTLQTGNGFLMEAKCLDLRVSKR